MSIQNQSILETYPSIANKNGQSSKLSNTGFQDDNISAVGVSASPTFVSDMQSHLKKQSN